MSTMTAHQQRGADRAARREAGEALRTEVDAWVEKIGGWDKPGFKTDFAVMAEYLSDRKLTQAYISPSLSMWLRDGAITDAMFEAVTRVNNHFKQARDPQAAYVRLIRAAHGAPELTGEGDWPFDVRLLSLDELFADMAYQRPIHEDFVRQLVITLDERLVGTIDVSERANGTHAILDGQQRVEAMKRVGKRTAYCSVYNGMSIPDEAAFFYHKNRDRKQMAYYYAFRARLLSGNPQAQLLTEIVNSAGFTLDAKTDNTNAIGAVRSVEYIYDLPGGEWGNVITPTLETIKACWHGRPGSLDASLIQGLGRFFSIYGPGELSRDHFHETLTGMAPQLVLGRARDFHNGNANMASRASNISIAMATILAQIHNQGLPREKRLDLGKLPLTHRQRMRKA